MDLAYQYAIRIHYGQHGYFTFSHLPDQDLRSLFSLPCHHRLVHHDGCGGDNPAAVHVLHETPHVLIGGIGQDLLGGTDLLYLPVTHDGDTVAELDSLLQVMRDKYDGLFHLRLQGQQLVLHLYPYQRVQGGEGLVHQQDFRIIR